MPIFQHLIHRMFIALRRSRSIGLSLVGLLVAISILGNAICFYIFDGAAAAEGEGPSWGDALWYSVISITTIGYGDFSATSLGARIGTVIFIVGCGLTSFTLLLGIIADFVTELSTKGQRGMAAITDSNHIIIANYPGEARLRQVLRELRSDSRFGKAHCVLATDQISEIPIVDKGLSFVHGSPLDGETWEQANLAQAVLVLVLPVAYHDPNADAVSASISAVVHAQVPDCRIVSECLDEKRRDLFPKAEQVSIVCGLQVAGNLLVQELADPGVSTTLEALTSNLRGDTIYSISAPTAGADICTIAKGLVDHGGNLLAVIRGSDTITKFVGERLKDDDRLVYVAPERMEWTQLQAMGNGTSTASA